MKHWTERGFRGRLDEPIPFVVTDKGRVKLDDLPRVCKTCDEVGF